MIFIPHRVIAGGRIWPGAVPFEPDPDLLAWFTDHGLDPARVGRDITENPDGTVTVTVHLDGTGPFTERVTVQPRRPLPASSPPSPPP